MTSQALPGVPRRFTEREQSHLFSAVQCHFSAYQDCTGDDAEPALGLLEDALKMPFTVFTTSHKACMGGMGGHGGHGGGACGGRALGLAADAGMGPPNGPPAHACARAATCRHKRMMHGRHCGGVARVGRQHCGCSLHDVQCHRDPGPGCLGAPHESHGALRSTTDDDVCMQRKLLRAVGACSGCAQKTFLKWHAKLQGQAESEVAPPPATGGQVVVWQVRTVPRYLSGRLGVGGGEGARGPVPAGLRFMWCAKMADAQRVAAAELAW